MDVVEWLSKVTDPQRKKERANAEEGASSRSLLLGTCISVLTKRNVSIGKSDNFIRLSDFSPTYGEKDLYLTENAVPNKLGSIPCCSLCTKAQQYAILNAWGIRTPDAVLVSGTRGKIVSSADELGTPFVLMHNFEKPRLLFSNLSEFSCYLSSLDRDLLEGIFFLQRNVISKDNLVVRVQITDGNFANATRTTVTSNERGQLDHPPEGDKAAPLSAEDPLVRQYIALCREYHFNNALFEFVEDIRGDRWTSAIHTSNSLNRSVSRIKDPRPSITTKASVYRVPSVYTL